MKVLSPALRLRLKRESGAGILLWLFFVLNRDQGAAMVGQVRRRFRRYLELRLGL
jgi:hypothetical protein